MICLHNRPRQIARSPVRIGHAQLEALLDHISLPMFLLNRHRMLVYANAVGHEQLVDKSYVYIKCGRFQIHGDERCILDFEAAVLATSQGLSSTRDHFSTLSHGEDGNTRASVTIVPIPNDQEDDYFVAIILTAQESEESDVILRLQQTLGLTPAEARIAFLICKGRRPRTIADDLSFSVNTVKSHLARVLSKTGCSNQAALCVLAGQLLTPIRAASKTG
jgi:DNA-binding CsgD family transcriptional regulator